MTTRIVFTDKDSVTVTDEVQEVRDRLAEATRSGDGFAQFEQHGVGFGQRGVWPVFVAADRVADIQEVRGG